MLSARFEVGEVRTVFAEEAEAVCESIGFHGQAYTHWDSIHPFGGHGEQLKVEASIVVVHEEDWHNYCAGVARRERLRAPLPVDERSFVLLNVLHATDYYMNNLYLLGASVRLEERHYRALARSTCQRPARGSGDGRLLVSLTDVRFNEQSRAEEMRHWKDVFNQSLDEVPFVGAFGTWSLELESKTVTV